MMNASSGRYFLWRRVVVALVFFLTPAFAAPASAGEDAAGFEWSAPYAGAYAGFARTENRIVDVDGFANWGNAGSALDYRDSGFLFGGLIGAKFRLGGLPLRVEADAAFGDAKASSNRLDPQGRDETVESEIRWMATARAGVERPVGPVTAFVSGGIAAARIGHSVTDIDFGPNAPPRFDPDDSFRAATTEFGWTISLGFEFPLADSWTMRVEGSYTDFGRSVHYVNRSGDNPCGPEMPRRACPYHIDAELASARLVFIYSFGP